MNKNEKSLIFKLYWHVLFMFHAKLKKNILYTKTRLYRTLPLSLTLKRSSPTPQQISVPPVEN